MKPSNVLAYSFKQSFEYSIEELEAALKKDLFAPCGKQQPQALGWVPALGKHGTQLVHKAGDWLIISAKHQEKLLPNRVVNDELARLIDKVELEENRVVKNKEKSEIKENIISTLLPQAFDVSKVYYIWLNAKQNIMFVDLLTKSRADELTSLLRRSLGSLPIVPLDCHDNFNVVTTDFFKAKTLPQHFKIFNDVVKLVDPSCEDVGVKFNHIDAHSSSVINHLNEGLSVDCLRLDWRERIQFTLKSNFTIASIKFADALLEQNSDIPKEDMPAKLDADAHLFGAELQEMFEELFALFGGVGSEVN